MSCGETSNGACRKGDLVESRLAWLVWFLPSALVLAGVFWGSARAFLWIPSLVVMGGACLANAARCRRLHCHLTGPLFLLGAGATLLDALGVVRIDWPWILGALVAGTLLAFALEWARGKYVATRERPRVDVPG